MRKSIPLGICCVAKNGWKHFGAVKAADPRGGHPLMIYLTRSPLDREMVIPYDLLDPPTKFLAGGCLRGDFRFEEIRDPWKITWAKNFFIPLCLPPSLPFLFATRVLHFIQRSTNIFSKIWTENNSGLRTLSILQHSPVTMRESRRSLNNSNFDKGRAIYLILYFDYLC